MKDLEDGSDINLIAEKIIVNRKHRDNLAGILPGPLGDYLDGDTIDKQRIEKRLGQVEQAWHRGLKRLDAKMKESNWK